jgi:hypothetical protein
MSFRFRTLCRLLAIPMAAVIFVSSMPMRVAHADLVPTDRVLDGTAGVDNRTQVQQFLAREDVQLELKRHGVDPAEAAARVDSLSEAEVSQLAEVIRQDPAGSGAVGAVIGAVVLIFIILLITDILGLTKVFPFTRSAR